MGDPESNPKLPFPGGLGADVFDPCCDVCPDEDGTATETKAMEENCSPKEICDSFDEVGRTSSPQRTGMSISGEWLSEYRMEQVCHNTPHFRDIDCFFLEHPKPEDALVGFINKMPIADHQSGNAFEATEVRLKAGRAWGLEWGVPVPYEKYEDKVSTTECYNVKIYMMNAVPLPFPHPTVNAFSWNPGNAITFTDADLPPDSGNHIRPLCVTAELQGILVPKVVIDNGQMPT